MVKEEAVDSEDEDFVCEFEEEAPPIYRPGKAKKPGLIVKLKRQAGARDSAELSDQDPASDSEQWWDVYRGELYSNPLVLSSPGYVLPPRGRGMAFSGLTLTLHQL